MRRGFTLIEMLLAVAMVGIISAAVFGVSLNMLRSNDLESTLQHSVQILRRAQTLARASDGDSPWGVKVQAGSATLFQGTSYALRNTALDETTEIPSTITPSGLTEVVFAKSSGLPQSTGVITLTHEYLGARYLFLNSIGVVDEVVSGQALTLTSLRDATLTQSAPTSNDGTSTSLQEYPRNNGYNKRFVVWFNLSSIPLGAQITSAVLRLRETQTYGATRSVSAHRMTQPWTESSVTWNTTAAAIAPTPTSTVTLSWTGTLKSDQWDVTTDVQAFVNSTSANYGWLIKDNQEDLSEAYWYFSSREGATPPELVLSYTL